MNNTLVCFVCGTKELSIAQARVFLQKAVGEMQANPFGAFVEMSVGTAPDAERYAPEKLSQAVLSSAEQFAVLRGFEPNLLTASIRLQPVPLLQIMIDADRFSLDENSLQAQTFTNRLKKVLPNCGYGIIDAHANISEFYDRQQLDLLPECFNYYLSWKTLLTPLGYQAYFERADLLKAPAFKVEELEDQSICLTAYPQASNYEHKESQIRIVELTNYLNQKRKDGK